jgi:hypothetical protein
MSRYQWYDAEGMRMNAREPSCIPFRATPRRHTPRRMILGSPTGVYFERH